MSLFTQERKQEIADQLKGFCRKHGGQNRAAAMLNIGASTLSAIVNDKFESVSDTMWKKIRDQVSTKKSNWELVETPTFSDIYFALETAHDEQITLWVTSPAGSGKSTVAKYYKSENRDVIYVLCDEDMSKLSFATELARASGLRQTTTGTSRERMTAVIDYISEMDNPLIIFDEGDKLNDKLLYYFITMYNMLEGKAGIVFLSTDYMQKRMRNGLVKNHKGYQEISSRIGRKFFEAIEATANDISAICRANGIGDENMIAGVVREAEAHSFDLRRVERKVKALRRRMKVQENN